MHLRSINGEITEVNIFLSVLSKQIFKYMNITEINRSLNAAQAELARLDAQRLTVLEQIKVLKDQKESMAVAIDKPPNQTHIMSNQSSAQEKISKRSPLFHAIEV